MPKNNESLNKELYSLLKTRGFDPIPKDATGETSPVPDDADVFKFTFKHDNQVTGTAYATIDGNNTLTVYYDDEVVSEEVGGVDDVNMSWTNFLKYLKMWAQRRQMGFDLENKDHLHSDMAQRDYVKKQEVAESKKKLMNKGTTMPNISEGYYAMGKNSSYNDNIPTVKIILQHSRQIQEGEQRYRNVARIYLENTQGERFLAPTVKPGIAQVYARHLAEGGSVNDERWNHIKSLCEEYSKMAGFVRAVRGNQFNESAQKLVEAGLNHYVSLRETLGKMRGNRGYNSYFESWTPTLMETDGDETSINELFVQETLDPRIESVMPILSKLSKNLSEVKEVKELEEWANGLLEAPGAETLAHNQSTAKSNLKAFDLEEDSVNEGWFADTLKSVGKAVLDKLAPNDKQLLLQLQRDMGVPTTAQHGKPSMARMMSDEEVQKLIAAARKVNAGRNSSLSEEEVEESGLQAYLGNKKYGKDGMDSLRKAGREGASKEKMAKIRAKYDKLDEEGLGPEQKRVGQLGPTEKVKKNSGARGKLVGANESVEQGVAEGKSVEGMKYVLVDYRGNYFKGMDKFGRNLSTRNPEEAEIFNLERDAKDIALWTRNRFKAIPWSGQQGVAEANVSKYKDLGATNATTHFLKNVTTGEIISPHRSRADADEALQAATNKNKEGHKFTIVRARKQGVAEGSLPKGFFNGRGFEAARFKEQGNMPMYHAAMSDQHLKYAKHFSKTNPEKARWHGEQSEQHIKQMRTSTKQGVAEAAKYRDPKYLGKLHAPDAERQEREREEDDAFNAWVNSTDDFIDPVFQPDIRSHDEKVPLNRQGKPYEKDPLASRKDVRGRKDKTGVKRPFKADLKAAIRQGLGKHNLKGVLPEQGVAEGSDTQLSIQQLATISDEALDNAYGYGRSSPGNTFGWQANLMSAAYAKKMIDAGVTDIEKISDAIHKGWNVTAQKFVQNPDQFDDTEKLRQAGKLEAKLQQRAKLMKINYAQLDNEEQEKDRVVARALLQAIKNQQGVAEGQEDLDALKKLMGK